MHGKAKAASSLRFVDQSSQTHTSNRTPLNGWGRYLHNTQQTQETNTHAPNGIRTCDPRKQRLKSYIWNRRATGIGECKLNDLIFYREARGGAVGSG